MKSMQIETQQLCQMQEILSESAGYQISVKEEIKYFDPAASRGWTLIEDSDGRQVGSIRHFRQGADWSLGEFFLKPDFEGREKTANGLLAAWKVAACFPPGHRIRFDIQRDDHELNGVLEKNGFSQKRQLFRHFELPSDSVIRQVTRTQTVHNSDAAAVSEALSNLHPVESSEALAWIEAGSIRVVRVGSQITAAAQIFKSADSVEINRFATHANFLRCGHGAELLDQIISEARNADGKRLYLKVEEARTAAIELYKKVGFVENPGKAQIWHSRWF